MTELIDRELVREQFANLGPELAGALAEAVDADFSEWSEALARAAEADDAEAMRRARHSLRGLCGNFGAHALDRLATGPLDLPTLRAALVSCAQSTVAAIQEIAGEAG